VPSGIVHAQCTFILAVPAFGLAYGASNEHIATAAACGLGCLLGIPLTPDLDQETLNSSEHAIVKWTFGLGFLWVMFWYPYARLCKHRSPLSHWPVLGTLGRLLYLTIPAGIAFSLGWKPPQVSQVLLLWGVGGLMLSDTGHWLLDAIYGEKRRRRR
jgi:uncharacterized metal-binding protein